MFKTRYLPSACTWSVARAKGDSRLADLLLVKFSNDRISTRLVDECNLGRASWLRRDKYAALDRSPKLLHYTLDIGGSRARCKVLRDNDIRSCGTENLKVILGRGSRGLQQVCLCGY